jgi:hypothetical protein
MSYEGWHNYQTWNVALHIGNNWDLYGRAIKYVEKTEEPTYDEFATDLRGEYGCLTPDHVSWTDPTIDREELNMMLSELGGKS